MNYPALLAMLVNAAWMACALALLCAAIERTRVSPYVREWLWTLALVLLVLAPAAAPFLPHRAAIALPNLRFIAGVETARSGSGVPWTRCVIWAYATLVALAALRLLWRALKLRGLNECTITTPLTFGHRVLLPERFRREATPLAVEAALAHEHTHVARGDFARHLALEIATLPVAPHPAVWFMKKRLAQARELVCDDLTARAFGDRRRYAQGLLEAARALTTPSSTAPALGMLDHTDFEERIMFLHHPAPPRFRRGLLLLGALLAIAPSMTLSGFYFQEKEKPRKPGAVTSAPRLIYKEEPAYSDAAEAEKVQGTVVLGADISESGVAENIVVKRGLHPELDANAVESLKNWRFEPGTSDGQPVRVAATIEINFRLK